MAEEIPFKILVDTLAAEKTVGELRQEFKDLTVAVADTKVGTEEYQKTTQRLSAVKEVLNSVESDINDIAGANEKVTSSILPLQREYKELQKIIQTGKDASGNILNQKDLDDVKIKLGEVGGRIRDIKQQTIALDPEKRFQAFARIGSTIASGFAAAQGAVTLFGKESEDLVRILVKVQAATALAQGLQGLSQLRKEFAIFKIAVVEGFRDIKAAIGSTGIGLIIIALGTIAANWDKITSSISGVTKEQQKLNESSNKNLETQKDKLKTLEGQDNILKLQGKSEQEILKLKIQQTNETIQATRAAILQAQITEKSQVEAAERNRKYLEGFLNFVTYPQRKLYELAVNSINSLIGLINKIPGVKIDIKAPTDLDKKAVDFLANLGFDPEKVKADADKSIKENNDALNNLLNQRAGFILQLNGLNEKGAEERKKLSEKERKEELERLSTLREFAIKAETEFILEQQALSEAAADERISKEVATENKSLQVKIDALQSQKALLESQGSPTVAIDTQISGLQQEQINNQLEGAQKLQSELYFIKLQGLQEQEKLAIDAYGVESKEAADFNNQILQLTQDRLNQQLQLIIDNNLLEAQLRQQKAEDDNLSLDERTSALFDVENAQYAQRLSQVKLFYDAEGKLTADSQKKLELLSKQHDANLTKIKKDGEQQRLQLSLTVAKNTIGAVGDLATALAGKTEASQRKAFNINKAAGIATATIDTILAVQKALATYPPPFNIIASVAAGITGAANVAKIASTQFQSTGGGDTGGGGAPSFSGGDFSGGSIPTPTPPPAPTPQLSQTILNTDENGNFTGFGDNPNPAHNIHVHVKADVVENEMTKTQKIIRGIEDRAKF